MMKLKALFLSAMGVLCLNFAHGQSFKATETLEIQNLENVSFQWVDLNQDFHYDLFVHGKQVDSDYSEIQVYINLGTGTFEKQTVTIPDLTIHQLQLKDFNRDRNFDVVFSGVVNDTDSVVSVLFGSETFAYRLAPEALISEVVEDFEMLDLDYDTFEDLLIGQRSDQDSLEYHLYAGGVTGFEKVETDFPVFSEGGFFSFDMDRDGRRDLIFSGVSWNDTTTFAKHNLGELRFINWPIAVGFDFHRFDEVSISEFSEDKFPDFFVGGQNGGSGNRNALYQNSGNQISVTQEFLSEHEVTSSLMADFDSDGKTDLWVEAERNDSTFVYWFNNVAEFSDTTGVYRDSLLVTAFADWNLDGHLDYAELQQGEEHLEIVVFENELEGNNYGPYEPRPQVAVQTGFGQMTVSWQETGDSLTHYKSISYDALLMDLDTTELFETNMNTESFVPTLPFHGNQLYADKLVVNNLEPGEYYYYVRALDNSFNFLSQPGSGGPGDGEFELGKAVICGEEEIVADVELCEGSFRVFGKEGVIRNWYSEELGAIATTDLLTYTVEGDDVLYGSVTEFTDCSEGQLVFNITSVPQEESSLDIQTFTLLCEPEEVTYTLSDNWLNVTWTSDVLGELSTDNALTFTPEESDRILVQAENEQGCTYQAWAVIEVVDFEPGVEDSLFTIRVGESVELMAFGGDTYQWVSDATLSDIEIANPVASPRITTEYTVIIQTDQGCSEQFTIRVEVEQIGGVANLFSPNGDNRNDQFYLNLSSIPSQIDFRIYTRAGNLVYQATNGTEATSQGWDGTHRGKPMPPGVYYWRVQGTYADGKPIILNKENSGKVHLIR